MAHDHTHPHDHGDHHHDRDHGRAGGAGWWRRLRGLLVPHGHADTTDPELEASRHGQRALLVSVLGLGATALLQAVVVWLSGSVALLGDTLHNFADALTAVPLAALAAFEAVRRLRDPADVRYLGAVAGAALVGFAGNELVARYRIAVGRRIGSAALVADGLHARSDGFASLAVLLGVAGVALGAPLADPVIGLAITGAILVVGWDAARQVYRRLMDAVDPSLVGRVEQVLRATPGVLGVGELRLRWIGHRLRAECAVTVDHHLTVVEGHHIAEAAEHRLLHQVPRLTAALVHADPFPHQGSDYHELTRPHAAPACPSTAPAT